MYNDFLKSINDVKRKVRTAQNIKRKALKKDIKASEEDVKVIEDNALTNEEIDFKCNEVKIYCFSNGDKYIGKIKDAKMDGIGTVSYTHLKISSTSWSSYNRLDGFSKNSREKWQGSRYGI